jgi:hypothetical protein
MKIRPVGAETDMMKLIVAISNFANAHKNNKTFQE